MKLAPRLIPVVMLIALVGCSSTPPLTQVYAARQTYTGSLNALTMAIQTGQISDRDTLLKIKSLRVQIEKGLDDAEAKARAGDRLGAQFLLDQVSGWLEEYLILQKPATRPTSLNTENPWTPQQSSRSSWAEQRQLPDWYLLMKPSPAAERLPKSRWQASAPNRLLLKPETTPR